MQRAGRDPVAALMDHKLQVCLSCCIIVFPADSDLQHCGAEVKFTSFEVRQTGLASYLHHFLAM